MSANFVKFNFFEKFHYGAPHMTIYGAQVNRKCTGSGSEVEREHRVIFYNRVGSKEIMHRVKKHVKMVQLFTAPTDYMRGN